MDIKAAGAPCADVARAVAACEQLPAERRLVGLAHLLSPMQTLVGLGIRVVDGQVSFRDATILVDSEQLNDAGRRINALVASRWEMGDIFLDLTQPVSTWLKPVRSGGYVLLGGAQELWGSPSVRLYPDSCSGGVVRNIGRALAQERLASFSELVSFWAPGRTQVTFGTPPLETDLTPSGSAELARSCGELVLLLDATALSWRPTRPAVGPMRFLTGTLVLPCGTTVEIPVWQDGSTRSWGVTHRDVVALNAPMVSPAPGWRVVGTEVGGGRLILEHLDTHVCAVQLSR